MRATVEIYEDMLSKFIDLFTMPSLAPDAENDTQLGGGLLGQGSVGEKQTRERSYKG